MKNLSQLHKYIISNTVLENEKDIKTPKFTAIVFLAQPSEIRAVALAKKMFKDIRDTDGTIQAWEYKSKQGQEIFKAGLARGNRIDQPTVEYTAESELLRYANFDAKYRAKILARKSRLKKKTKEATENFIALQSAVGGETASVSVAPKRKISVTERTKRDRVAEETVNRVERTGDTIDDLARLMQDFLTSMSNNRSYGPKR